jgi:hypothetical protein
LCGNYDGAKKITSKKSAAKKVIHCSSLSEKHEEVAICSHRCGSVDNKDHTCTAGTAKISARSCPVTTATTASAINNTISRITRRSCFTATTATAANSVANINSTTAY